MIKIDSVNKWFIKFLESEEMKDLNDKYDIISLYENFKITCPMKKPNRDPNLPKKPMNAYMFYCVSIRNEYKSKDKSITVKEIGEKWKQLSTSSKEKWNKLSINDKERYEKEMEPLGGTSKKEVTKKKKTGWNIYCAENRKNHTGKVQEVTKLLSTEWKKLDDDEKETYNEMANKYNEEHNLVSDDEPKKKSKKSDVDEDIEKPKKSKKSDVDEEEVEKPKKKSKKSDVDEEEMEKPKKKSKKSDDEEEIENLEVEKTEVEKPKEKSDEDKKLKKKLREMILYQIKCDLTVGLEDNDKTRWSKDEINGYIKTNKKKIYDLVEYIIEQDDDVEEWSLIDKPDYSILREYMNDEEGPFEDYSSMIEKLYE
jgi:hypothetical protein